MGHAQIQLLLWLGELIAQGRPLLLHEAQLLLPLLGLSFTNCLVSREYSGRWSALNRFHHVGQLRHLLLQKLPCLFVPYQGQILRPVYPQALWLKVLSVEPGGRAGN